MSYILDALNKSEQERQQRENGVTLQPLTGVPHAGNGGPRWLPIAAVAVVLAAIGVFAGVYFAMKSRLPAPPVAAVSAPPPATKPAPVVEPPASVVRSAPAPTAAATASAAAAPAASSQATSEVSGPAATPARAAASDTVKSLYQRKGMSTEEAMAQSAADDSKTAPITGKPVTGDNVKDGAVKTFDADQTASVQTQEAVRQSTQSRAATQPALPKSTINQKALDAAVARQRDEELAARVQAELDEMQAQDAAKAEKLAKAQPKPKPAAVQPKPQVVDDPDANVPLATQLPADAQKRIPNIDFGAHVYAGRTNNGFVILNGKKRYLGDSVAPGLTVDRITEDGVILNMNGTRFKLNSMSSWIN